MKHVSAIPMYVAVTKIKQRMHIPELNAYRRTKTGKIVGVSVKTGARYDFLRDDSPLDVLLKRRVI